MAFYQRAFLYLWRETGEINAPVADLSVCQYDDSKHQYDSARRGGHKSRYAGKDKIKGGLRGGKHRHADYHAESGKNTNLRHVTSVNRSGENPAFLSNAVPITGSGSADDANWMVKLSSYDELAYDSPFVDRPYKLTQGDFLTADTKNSAVVHADFAEKNGLAIGDEVGVEIKDGKSATLKIIGLYRAGNERKQG